MAKKVLVPLAPGFEEIEAITVIDILRRAGVEVVVAGTQPGVIEASRKTKHVPDCGLDDVMPAVDTFDMIVLPGGQPGTTNLRADLRIKTIIERLRARSKLTAAICAAPTVLSAYGVLEGRRATSHPGSRAQLVAGQVVDERVVVDGPVVTSQAAGTAMEFAFKLVELLCGREKAVEVNQGVLARL
ncbi:MAG: DJ-1/PfpI family protein [Verrucomicrobiae bacterium]|nr:DJ-1/PfpI family protein [Verrucomicrobiae bacterium]